jgi:glutathione-regulated potassium-efflux system ancillary protein KefG
MNKILVLFAHPAFEQSKVHLALMEEIKQLKGVTIHDLYELYPDFDIDVEREKALLLAHDIIIWQHPLFWYSSPALLKQWEDLVLEHGWAYGKQGHALDGKKIFNVMSSGGDIDAYQVNSFHGSTIQDFLLPFKRTAQLCRMVYLPPFWVAGTHQLMHPEIQHFAILYKLLLIKIRDNELTDLEMLAVPFLNDLVSKNQPI